MTLDLVDVPVSKLIKLRNRAARGDGCEAENAANRLRELLDRYGLDEAYLLGAEVVEQRLDEKVDFNRMRLADALARSRSCRAGMRDGVGLLLRGPRRFVSDVEGVYKRVVEAGCRHSAVANAPAVIAPVFQKVFWTTFIDRIVQRLARMAPDAPTSPPPSETSARKQVSLDPSALLDCMELEVACADLVETLSFEGRDPYQIAADIQRRAITQAQALAHAVDLGEPPAWRVPDKKAELPRNRGLLCASPITNGHTVT